MAGWRVYESGISNLEEHIPVARDADGFLPIVFQDCNLQTSPPQGEYLQFLDIENSKCLAHWQPSQQTDLQHACAVPGVYWKANKGSNHEHSAETEWSWLQHICHRFGHCHTAWWQSPHITLGSVMYTGMSYMASLPQTCTHFNPALSTLALWSYRKQCWTCGACPQQGEGLVGECKDCVEWYHSHCEGNTQFKEKWVYSKCHCWRDV